MAHLDDPQQLFAPEPWGYRGEAGAWDEAFDSAGSPRPLYADLFGSIEGRDLDALRESVQRSVRNSGATFGVGRPFDVDPVPRLIGAAEWRVVETGVSQRLRALNAFCADAYSEQRIFDAGAVPRALLDPRRGYEPAMHGLPPDGHPAIVVAGMDLIRDERGSLLVLEDNARMPSGVAYALAVRRAVGAELPSPGGTAPLERFLASMADAIHGAAGEQEGGAQVALLSEGRDAGGWFEHEILADAIGAPIVTPDQLTCSGGRLFARVDGRRRPIDVAYRRLDSERLTAPDGDLTPLGELLVPALRSGRLRCANAFGTAIADDKLTQAHVETMVAFYLDEEPILRSVPSFDLTDSAQRARCFERIGDLVVKPRDGFGGSGIVILPRATAAERNRAIADVRAAPERFVAQEPVILSTHPTVCGERLEPRHVDLRPFAVSGPGGTTVLPGGLTRYARGAGDLVVNSSRGGGGKDTWVMAE